MVKFLENKEHRRIVIKSYNTLKNSSYGILKNSNSVNEHSLIVLSISNKKIAHSKKIFCLGHESFDEIKYMEKIKVILFLIVPILRQK